MNNTEVAVVDYGLGNLFSVKQACDTVGLEVEVTSESEKIESAECVILPGVGAFEKAMNSIRNLGLLDTLKETPNRGQLLVGICLGSQLLLSESMEFGRHKGLDIIEGKVVKLESSEANGKRIKVPHVGWNTVKRKTDNTNFQINPLKGVENEYMYFVHSYYMVPEEGEIVSETEYGKNRFCSTVVSENVVGLQFHPERSGPAGLKIYRNIKNAIIGEE